MGWQLSCFARKQAFSGGKANHCCACMRACNTLNYDEASLLLKYSSSPGEASMSMNDAGFPSRRGAGGCRALSEMGPPFQIGRSRSLPGSPTTKKEPTLLGRSHSLTFLAWRAFSMNAVYSARSRAIIFTEPTPTVSFGKISLG